MSGLKAQMRIGSMADKVSFRLPVYGRDAYGGVQEALDESTYDQYRAEVIELSAAEVPADTPQDKVTSMIRVRMRSLGDANPSHQHVMSWSRRGIKRGTYDIIDITFTERDRFMTIKAKLISTGS